MKQVCVSKHKFLPETISSSKIMQFAVTDNDFLQSFTLCKYLRPCGNFLGVNLTMIHYFATHSVVFFSLNSTVKALCKLIRQYEKQNVIASRCKLSG